MSALSTGVAKKRKKSETKPQAQINKCNNEKKRREQENIYIEELAELISANIADMSSLSVKPDKCAILQETVNQIRSIKQRENSALSCDPVQQGEVSSSRPNILSNEIFGPLLLEALEGFLFVVNSEGKVEYITENVSTYIKYTKDEVFGKSIYNFIHHGDHAKFSSCLLPMSIGWANEPNRSRSFSIRLLVKPIDDLDETIEEKQQRISCYEVMHISSTQLRDQISLSADEDTGESGPCLLCVASRICHRDKVDSSIEQFTTKLDRLGNIIGVDTSGISTTYSPYINKELMHRAFKDIVPALEVHKLTTHLRETLSVGQSTSDYYRLQVSPEKFVQVQTKSKLFKTNPNSASETDFIMATHSIIGESDFGSADPGGGSSSVGGPLMTSVVNGNQNGASVGSGSDNSATSTGALLPTNALSYNSFSLENDFNFDFPSSTWELESTNWTDGRTDSRQTTTPTRPPSNPAYSPSTSIAQSPMAQFVAQNSPSMGNPSAATPSYSNSFPYSPISEKKKFLDEQKDTKANVLEESPNIMSESNKLRNLLTKPSNILESVNDSYSKNKNKILKTLLNQQDEDDNRTSPRSYINKGPGPSELPKSSILTGRNNMLLDLLNDKSDDDDLEAKADVKKKSELLQILLKPERGTEGDDRNTKDIQAEDDSLLKSLGFSTSPSPQSHEPGQVRKRSSEDQDDNPNKRLSDGSQVSSSGPSTSSKLCERNKMLASLLAKQPSNHQPIPPIPASVISATPQEKLPRITDSNINKRFSNTMLSQAIQQHQNLIDRGISRVTGRATNYLNAMLSSERMPRIETKINQASYTSHATSSSDNNNSWVDNNNTHPTADPVLSELLDQVIDIVPDHIIHLLDSAEPQQNNFQTQEISEKMAINIIQKSLMQCESVVKSSASISMSNSPTVYTSTASKQNRTFISPNYHQPYALNHRAQIRSNYPLSSNNMASSQQQQLLQQQKLLTHQQQQKLRLLQQQQQQHMLIPSNAQAGEVNTGIQNIDSLLNNTVAPNVTLQRSSSVPEQQQQQQQSASYNSISQQNQRVGNQQYSPHTQIASSIQQSQNFSQTVGNYQQATSRLSPQTFQKQLSPRQPYAQQGNPSTSNWHQQPRLSVQNPMLNAQLTRPPQQQRAENSPGPRSSSFAGESYPPSTSPNSAFSNQYLNRLHRTNSVPTATTQLPGAPTSEFVRQELRAVVGARTSQAQPTRASNQMLTQQQVADLEVLGLTSFDIANSEYYGGSGR